MDAKPSESLTIGHLARAADVGVETVRYYQQRGLLPVPPASGAFRRYPMALVSRIRFIKRAQELGFSLDEIGDLLRLEDGSHRASIRGIASARLTQIEAKVADLERMQTTLRHLVTECEHTPAGRPCPIIASLVRATVVLPGATHGAIPSATSERPASDRTRQSPSSGRR